jgi:rare lipoprotein A
MLGGVSLLSLASCGLGGFGQIAPVAEPRADGAARSIATGPAADYPMVLGEPFTIDGITYTPADTYNYDEVGYATLGDEAATGITVEHRTLPLPSYVEVTSLDSGQTILARVERRGPMTNARLLGLSRAAAEQLNIEEGAPVRVRRVNPPEDQRAELRADRSVAPRMETPQGLLDVLKRQLPPVGSASLARAETADSGTLARDAIETIDPTTAVEATPAQTRPTGQPPIAPSPSRPSAVDSSPAPTAATVPAPSPDPAPVPEPAARGDFAVQAGAYSSRGSAQKVADAIGGYLEPAGSLFRVRVGPFGNRGEAASALAKVRAAGYRDAQIVSTR